MAAFNKFDRFAVERIIDANANRAAEGIRVVEEAARFVLGDEDLTARLKSLRHEIRSIVDSIAAGAVAHRQSDSDVGRSSAISSELSRSSLLEVVKANFARAQEALRVLEEFGKLLSERAARRFKYLRFELYTLERNICCAEAKVWVLPAVPFFYPILDRSFVPESQVSHVAEQMVSTGISILQYRAKGLSRDEMRRDLAKLMTATRLADVALIVNDDVELAVEVEAAGAHVGKEDMDPRDARAILGPKAILGASIASPEELDALPWQVLSYAAIGPVFESLTKPELAAVGLDALRTAKARAKIPLVAIGGITVENAPMVLEAGADGVAVVSAVLSGDVRKNCFTFMQVVGKKK